MSPENKDLPEKRYCLEVGEKQLKCINAALEEYFRIRMGQFTILSEDLSSMDMVFPSEKEKRDKEVDSFFERRDNTKIVLDAAYRIATGDRWAHGIAITGRTDTSRVCEDVWQVIRHQLWKDSADKPPYTVDSHPPLPVSDLPLPTCTMVEEKFQSNGYPIIVFDFDGVIHSYKSGWMGPSVIPDGPVPGIRESIQLIRESGYKVVVVSTRCATQEGREAVKNWLFRDGITVDAVLKEKPPAVCYVDDRAICFDGNANTLFEKIRGFEPWYKK